MQMLSRLRRLNDWWRARNLADKLAVLALFVGVVGVVGTYLALVVDPSPTKEPKLIGSAVLSTTTLVPPEEILLSFVGRGIKESCTISKNSYYFGHSAVAIECYPRGLSQLMVALYETTDLMYADYFGAVQGAEGIAEDSVRNCGNNKPGEGEWRTKDDVAGGPTGRLLCSRDADRNAWVEWTYDAQKIYAAAHRADGNIGALHEWWEKFSSTKSTASTAPSTPRTEASTTTTGASASSTAGTTELQAQDCSRAPSLKATSDTSETEIEIVNHSSRVIKAYWLNYDGKREPYGSLQPQESQEFVTYATHPWLIANSSDECISIFVADEQPGRAVIR
jgi:hypothetical protein